MQTTSPSLLVRLRQPGQPQAWARFVDLYAPLLYHWARRLTPHPDDAAELVQDVFVILVRQLPQFDHQPGRRFRGWLWTVLRNAWRARRRKAAAGPGAARAADLDDLPAPEGPSQAEEDEDRRHFIGRALRLVRDDCEPVTWQAFQEYAVAGRAAAEVAAELGLSANAVRLARSRVLRRLRAELDGVLD